MYVPLTPNRPNNGSNTRTSERKSFRAWVPKDVRPGEEFHVNACNRMVRVICPNDARSGDALRITIADDSPPDSPNVIIIPNTNPLQYLVTIPDGVRGGQQFAVTIQGHHLFVTCPPNSCPKTTVRIFPPINVVECISEKIDEKAAKMYEKTQLLDVLAQKRSEYGKPFPFVTCGAQFLANCPSKLVPGEKIRFELQRWLEKNNGKSNQHMARMDGRRNIYDQ